MSFYQLLPSPQRTHEQAYWENNLSGEEIEKIRVLGDSLAPQTAVIGSGVVDLKIRHAQVGWIELTSDSQWIYDRLAWIARQLNGQFFQIDIIGFSESLQYTVYHPDNSHYDWHVDMNRISEVPRKLSLVMQLSDPDEYEGGDLQFLTGPEPITAQRGKGIVYAFPSYIVHRVTPVTRGIRRSLVAWICGPQFR